MAQREWHDQYQRYHRDNGTQPVALVKTGASQLNLNGAAPNTYTAELCHPGTLNVLTTTRSGPQPIRLL